LILKEKSRKLLMERTGKDQESTVGCAKVSTWTRLPGSAQAFTFAVVSGDWSGMDLTI
jgi:hypothetical protein